jgi:hypothetical protein
MVQKDIFQWTWQNCCARFSHGENHRGRGLCPLALREAAANLLTIDALDRGAKIPEFKACAVQVFPARDDELSNPDVVLSEDYY